MPGDQVARLCRIRSQFPGAERWIYLDTAAHGLMPLSGRDAIARYVDDCINLGGARATMRDALDRLRERFAQLIGADALEIAAIKNVSEGVNSIVTSLRWRPGDNAVLCSEVEHPNSVYALYNVRARHGIEVRSVAPTDDLAVSIEAIGRAIDEKTRLVIASTVGYTTGARTDLNALAALCRKRNVLLLVDAAQSLGALELNVRNTAIDAMAVGTSKFLCGPPGFGLLYVRRKLAEQLLPGSLARYGVDLGELHEGEMSSGSEYNLMPGARRFEAGSYNYMGANAADAALQLLQEITVPAIERHVLDLARRLSDGLRQLNLPLISRSNEKHCSHIVVMGRRAADAAMQRLVREIYEHLIANTVKLSMRSGRLRFAFHLYNTVEEVEAVLSLIRARMSSPGNPPHEG